MQPARPPQTMEPGEGRAASPPGVPPSGAFWIPGKPGRDRKWCASGIDCGEAVEISMLHLDCLSNGIELGPTTPVNLDPGRLWPSHCRQAVNPSPHGAPTQKSDDSWNANTAWTKQRSIVPEEAQTPKIDSQLVQWGVAMKGGTVRKLLLRMLRDGQLQRDVERTYIGTDATLRPALPGALFAAGRLNPRTMCWRNDI